MWFVRVFDGCVLLLWGFLWFLVGFFLFYCCFLFCLRMTSGQTP